MDYSFVKAKLDNGITVLVPQLPDEFSSYSDFLISDVMWNDEYFTQAIESVLDGKTDSEEVTGNIGTLVINKERTFFYSFFSSKEFGHAIGTKDLYELVLAWKKALSLFDQNEDGNNETF